MNKIERQTSPLARNVRRLGHLDLPGAGQVCLSGSHAYVGHIPNAEHRGTSIVDVSDPKNPRVVATITLDDHESHSHKARVVGDILIVNHERNMSKIGRRAEQLPAARRALTERLGRGICERNGHKPCRRTGCVRFLRQKCRPCVSTA